MRHLLLTIAIVLLASFCFLTTTAVMDVFCRSMGYYNEGITESQSWQ